ncbi:MAG: immunoglobulin domain-containing protein [Burkholderiales bacterium]|nr:immunoglobulin domain-containing protein [Burkholderiales bacterium]MDE2076339.1 immunoglobulin domain-containing protein [Burkholderiales bacterium]MDE2433270.1 immunoglobulin domain-containing protein [Burkholderiales bacterium]
MRRLHREFWFGLLVAGLLSSCGGGSKEPTPPESLQIQSDAVPQSFPTDASISVQMSQWQQITVPITQGYDLTMTVHAVGAPPLSYSWRKNNNVVEWAGDSQFVIHNIQPTDAGNYTVTVANGQNIAVSQSVRVVVKVPQKP